MWSAIRELFTVEAAMKDEGQERISGERRQRWLSGLSNESKWFVSSAVIAHINGLIMCLCET